MADGRGVEEGVDDMRPSSLRKVDVVGSDVRTAWSVSAMFDMMTTMLFQMRESLIGGCCIRQGALRLLVLMSDERIPPT